jgi:LmbE family N-acetylglucosaminyl deacetylase
MTIPGADLYIPDGEPLPGALGRVTHLGVGAHQDDLEFMAFHGIAACYGRADRWFAGVTCTDGRGSPRTGRFAGLGDTEMAALRACEQREAARTGGYAAVWQLGYASADLKGGGRRRLVDDLEEVLRLTRPAEVYTHNPADKHDTHVAVCGALVAAVRRLDPGERPGRVLGCEVWRDLDWLPDRDKVALDVSGHAALAAALNAAFASQIEGGKRYDLAVMGRRRANATFSQSHAGDAAAEVWLALDLTPLALDDQLDLAEFTLAHIDRFRSDVAARLGRMASAENY